MTFLEKKVRVAVCGSTGFVGRHLCKYFRMNGNFQVFEVSKTSGIDLTKRDDQSLLPEVEVIIHLAGRVGVIESWENAKQYIDENVSITSTIAEYGLRCSAPVIFLSSYLYGEPKVLPIAEDHPLDCRNPYAVSKRMSEDLLFYYHKLFGLDVTILRPFNLYGSGMSEDTLIGKIMRQLSISNQVEVLDLIPKRDYLYIYDLCDAIQRIADRPNKNYSVYNVASGESYSVLEVIQEIAKAFGKTAEIRTLETRRRNEIDDCYGDYRKLQSEYGWKAETSFKQGLQSIVNDRP